MITIDVPGYKEITVEHIVLDYNGTLAVDGQVLGGVREALNRLAEQVQVHVVTADTFGKSQSQLEGVSCKLSVLSGENQDLAKLNYVCELGADRSVCVGNGRNDRLMLKTAALGIAVILGEGVATETLTAGDIVCTDILSALELLIHPLRLTATLRS